MYIFVLEWTPALTPKASPSSTEKQESIPHGHIFAGFMVSEFQLTFYFTLLVQQPLLRKLNYCLIVF